MIGSNSKMKAFLAVLRRLSSGVLVAAACGLGLAACSTTGSSFDSSALRLIEPGRTTLAEASSLLKSDPTDTYRQQDGSAMARWSHKASLVTDAVYFNQELWLAFGPDGRFERIVKSDNIPRADMFDAGNRVDTPAAQANALSGGAAPAGAAVQYPAAAAIPADGPHAVPARGAATPGALYKPAVSYPLLQ
ncbi:hypothetical protein SAMN04488135_11275 [Pollutimonas bauzanensis]|uniref:Beta-barrel assembly machine subunit BamE n=2 Tax=Pollutimonas bauzanensis TaxID=658167 RepID=A0A1M5Z4D1_9BURK|nr:hypothetical protein SAMN04488135_11275 [Pollutimonas bauzanensis]